MTTPTRAAVFVLHLPAHLVGRPVADILRVLQHPENNTMQRLAEEAHRCINNPDASLDLIVAQLEAERKAERDGRAIDG